MFDFSDFFTTLRESGLNRWRDQFKEAINRSLSKPDGNLKLWFAALNNLPDLQYSAAGLIDLNQLQDLKKALLQLKPWRKGPFDIFGIHIDSEWRSDMKWKRVLPHVASLENRKILDVGCGNGYYMFKMAEHGVKMVIGVDPSMLFLSQFTAIKKYSPPVPIHLLPIGFEELPDDMEAFDTVFSMGVFYHRRAPFDFLRSLRMLLRRGGELILETLIIEGDQNQVLVPPDRYARMNNVWFIPSAAAMAIWLEKAGFVDVKIADVSKTTINEQRATEWMPGESLAECLDPADQNLTIEGLPAPVRAIFICNRP